MEKLKIYVSGADIHVTALGKLTAGMVGATASFGFSPEWGDLLKTAVFEGSSVSKDVILTGSAVEIPPECLTRRGTLRVGVYGHLADGTIVIPTVMCNGVEIAAGTKPSGDTQSGYTPEKWAQMLGMIGDISHLTTEDRSTLVAAINEIAGYKGMELDDDQINEVIEYYFAKHPPTIGDMTMTGDLDMGSHRVKNVADPEEDGDAVPLKYAEDHFAPTGYGLGTSVKTATDSNPDNIVATGFYRCELTEVFGDAAWCEGYHLELYSGASTYSYQQFVYMGSAIPRTVQRVKINGVWQPWEWVNPPMAPGVEYRTTERWNGNPVYTKLLDVGNMPANGSSKWVEHGIGSQYPIRVYGHIPSYTLPFKTLTDEIAISVTSNYIQLHAYASNTTDWTGFSGVAQIWYIK